MGRIPHPPKPSVTWTGLFHLLVIYIVWGSTYLAIRVAVREGAGFPPFMMGAMRVVVAGGLLLLWSALARYRLRPSRAEMAVLAASGILLWTGGNGLVVWGEQYANSGLAALLVGSGPVWVAILQAVLNRRPPSWLLTGSLALGFGGIGLLSAPMLLTGTRTDTAAVIALTLAPVCWAAGSVMVHRRPVALPVTVYSAYQHLFGGIGFVIAALAFREPLPHPTPEAWLAWGYLVVFGSLLAFSSFIVALRLLPTSVAMTYAYVNPVIAAFLGWLILHETLTAWTIGGAALILLSVAGVFRDRVINTPRADRSPAPRPVTAAGE